MWLKNKMPFNVSYIHWAPKLEGGHFNDNNSACCSFVETLARRLYIATFILLTELEVHL